MNYHEAVGALQARGRFGMHLGLGRIRALLRELGDPQRQLRGALIAGTNGKGSVQALVSAVLAESGLHVGQTPKPHLVSYRERIVVDGAPIAAGDFASIIESVLDAAGRLRTSAGPPTEFELVTAAAFTWFAGWAVNCCVIEVGMGGRLDATNAWDGGIAAITNVDRDHMEYLGGTLPQIAREKAAIIKRGNDAITAVSGEALAPIRRRAARMRVPLRLVAPPPVVSMDRSGLVVRDPVHGELRVGLLGRHQAANVAVALGVLEAMAGRGLCSIDGATLRRGLEAARWPGRMELLALAAEDRAIRPRLDRPDPRAPDLLLDGAHNAAGARALAEAFDDLQARLSPGRPTLLVGVLRDKELVPMLDALRASTGLSEARSWRSLINQARSVQSSYRINTAI